jgi:hypothetical protein
VNKEDTKHFFAVILATHPYLIPNEVRCVVLELEEMLVVMPPLYIREEEIRHSKQDALHFHAFIHVLEVHDFSPPEEEDNGWSAQSDSSNDGDDGYMSYDVVAGLLQPWPNVYRLAGDSDVAGNPLSWLPQHGSGTRWLPARSQRAFSSKKTRAHVYRSMHRLLQTHVRPCSKAGWTARKAV